MNNAELKTREIPEWRNAEYHRKEILKIMEKIEDSWILWQMHRFVINITEEE